MKKIKIAILALLAVAGVGLLTGCGDAKTDDNGSSTDSGANNEQSTGIIEEIVTDAADGLENIGNDLDNGNNGGNNGTAGENMNGGANENNNGLNGTGATTNDTDSTSGNEATSAQQ